MAKKSKKNKQTQHTNHFFESVKHYGTSARVHFVIGLLICFFTVYIGIAMVSYLFTGAADQSEVDHLAVSDLISKKTVLNWAGIRGAYLSHVIMDHWFGIPSFFLLFFLGSAGFRLMKLCRMNLLRRFLSCSVLTVWSSLLLAFVFSGMKELSFFHLGGLHGDHLSEWLQNNIGSIGVILVLLTGFILIAIFMSRHTVSFLQSRLSFGNREKKHKEAPVTEDKPPYTYEDDESAGDEDDEDETDDELHENPEEEEDDGFDNKPGTDIGRGGFTVEIAKDDDELYDRHDLGTYDPRLDLSGYRFPEIDLLKKYDQSDKQVDMAEQNENQKRIKKTLEDFGINIVSIKATVGPTITLYEVVPDKGVRISKIRVLEDDIALSLSALGIRIIAPMPGKGT
ncbi:MAG: DNA translocase FtsK 4TM domain-containing protein, partial [Tannerella sp.]|nr:DNA translocase FtsK 4TM domain-containing protein [Tannerella sp.]